jgi:uncharacterized membrane protein YdjX (TVP38/TMEM64 family)
MKMLLGILRELAGLFVDDGVLALAIIGVIVVAAVFAALMPSLPLLAGAVLLFGCLGALLLNTMRAARR